MASTRRLQKIGIEPEILQKLVAQNLFSFKDILKKTDFELFQLLDVDIDAARQLLEKVSYAAVPERKTLLELCNEKKQRTFDYLPTTLALLDTYLFGGIPAGSITEIVGQSGMGKTQFCHMLSILASLPKEMNGLGGGTVYFDTETSFSGERIVEMAQSKFPDHFSNLEKLGELTTSIKVLNHTSSTEIIKSLESLESLIIEQNIKLVIVDSIASVVRKEYDNSSNNIMKRQDLLNKEAAILKYLAETFNIPVIVTNQVTSKVDSFSKKSFVTPALGVLWSHCVNNRIVLEYCGNNQRKITIAKSPIAPVVSFPYSVRTQGIVLQRSDDEDGSEELVEAEVNPENYWELKITPRTQVAPGMRLTSQHQMSVIKQQSHAADYDEDDAMMIDHSSSSTRKSFLYPTQNQIPEDEVPYSILVSHSKK